MAYLIAEIAQAHDGSIGILHSYIDALANTGIDAIKFQTHIAAAESSDFEPFRVAFSRQDATRFDYWKRMEFTLEQWVAIKKHCDDVGLDFISSPFSIAAVELLEKVGVAKYKIGSGEISNMLLLERIAGTGKQIILSSGMSSWQELDDAVSLLKRHGIEPSILQCTTAYPVPPEQWGLSYIEKIKQRYGLPVGFSDHSGTPVACIAAAALGAEILEFHVVFDKRMFGPDAKASLTINEIQYLANSIKMVEKGLTNIDLKEDNTRFNELKIMFGKSLAVNKDLPAGHPIEIGDLETKKPAQKGISAADFPSVIGKKLKHPLSQWSFLNESDLI
jgi:N,N'-diacetyllegionaminate synthase